MKKKSYIVSIILALALVISACAPAAAPASGGSAETETPSTEVISSDDLIADGVGKDYGMGPVGHDLATLVERMGVDEVSNLRIGVSVVDQSDEWLISWADEFRVLADEFDFEVVILSAQNDPIQQAADLRSLQSQHVDGIITFVNQIEALASTMNEIEAAGIPIVNAIEVTDDTEISAFVNVSQVEKGAMMADQVAAYAEEAGIDANVLLLNLSINVQSLQDRIDGFKEQAATHDNIHIIDERLSDSDSGFLNVTLESLLVNEDINVIFSTFLNPTIAAVAAVEQAGADVAIFGIDADQGTLEMLRDGRIAGLHVQFARANASLSLFTLLRSINGEQLEREVWEPDSYALSFARPEDAEDLLHSLYP